MIVHAVRARVLLPAADTDIGDLGRIVGIIHAVREKIQPAADTDIGDLGRVVGIFLVRGRWIVVVQDFAGEIMLGNGNKGGKSWGEKMSTGI